jgi:hypothetical protein
MGRLGKREKGRGRREDAQGRREEGRGKRDKCFLMDRLIDGVK